MRYHDVMDQLPSQDPSVLEALLRYGPPSFLVRLVDVYLETTGIHVERAESSASRGDWEGVAFAAHALKSSAGTLGLPRLLDAVQKLEVAARSEDAEQASSLVAGLRQIWTDSCAALVEYRAKL
jgi:HPt (histidine-containing phosphotransfer) domain-containing protein